VANCLTFNVGYLDVMKLKNIVLAIKSEFFLEDRGGGGAGGLGIFSYKTDGDNGRD